MKTSLFALVLTFACAGPTLASEMPKCEAAAAMKLMANGADVSGLRNTCRDSKEFGALVQVCEFSRADKSIAHTVILNETCDEGFVVH